ncbi:patatin-like phospholipase family protein [Paracoccus sp. Z118]|uniref:patatin-like phospholipase family protein n=1 Tax=Paracoccus sp. Z118 TaxID=2851017 RepID=UPI001C2BD0B4|nr:patatin-like phospholipase family protein [Paracoccus sp. Z118]MBV0891026.1 patatin-like phospholipase family protein [Paracoccus sp. Z118]
MRILSVSGGGFQALYGVLLLEALEERRGPLKEEFDLFCGSSAGAIVATAAAMGVPMSELREGFMSRGREAFQRRKGRSARNLLRLFGSARYEAGPLTQLIAELAGETTFSDLDVPLAVTAARLKDGAAILFEPRSHPGLLIREAVLASTAAPTMFPAVAVEGVLHADGAIFANAPDLLALDLALREGALAADVSMLSVGSMNACPPLGEPPDADMGVLDWIRGNRIFRTMIGAQAQMTARLMEGLLGGRYLRIDADPGFPLRGDVALDKADAKAVEAATMAAGISMPMLDEWLQVTRTPARKAAARGVRIV